MLAPVKGSQGIFVATLGLVKALNNKGIKACLFRPIDKCENIDENSHSVALCKAVKMVSSNQKSELLELIVANFKKFEQETNAKVYIVEGLVDDKLNQDEINAAICHALDADIMPVVQGKGQKAKRLLAITLKAYGNAGVNRVLGNIVLNANAPKDAAGTQKLVLSGCSNCSCNISCTCASNDSVVIDNIVAEIPYDMKNYAYRAMDLAKVLNAKAIEGNKTLRGYNVTLENDDNKETIFVTSHPVDTASNDIIILTDNSEDSTNAPCTIKVEWNLWNTVKALSDLEPVLMVDDLERKAYAEEMAAKYFNADLLDKLATFDENRTPLMSPAAFRYKLTELARKAGKRIALPEGDEPRTVCAAAKVAQMGIATPVLFGKKDTILAVAKEQGVELGAGVEFVDPDEIRANYVDRLVELRKKKGVTPEQAVEMLKDNVFLATMMLERNEVDGLVSGAVHTTANTIRPPLQIIKTAPGASIVSSVFFMLMPEQVYVFGDCAINPNPKPEELAEIAIQSADTAKTFGIDARVAMLTYSTINSGKGPDVDMVIEATKIAKEKRPDLCIDGPLQYDAAVMPNVAAQKAPNSPVAGKATVFIFPSLEVGNVCYKAVQRSADLVSIGPMLQGMRKPVNDLSRGALVDDIIYTIAITAIQATQA